MLTETAQAARVPDRGQGRLGPRPLPLHLLTAALTWSTSRAALPLLRKGSLRWRRDLAAAGAALQRELRENEADALGKAVEREVQRRMAALAEGILRYRRHGYRRRLVDPPALWRAGSTVLRDYGAGRADLPPVLFVPSLINRAYILDLTEGSSLLRWLADQGLRPLLVDWDRPGAQERAFDLTDYIAGRLEAALDAVLARTGRRPLLVGYCMGGLLALALALRRQADLTGLVLMATPWDFHAETGGQERLAAAALAACAPTIDLLGELPVDLIQTLFAGLDPQLVLRKFLGFARLDPASDKAATFVALEDWLNDGVPLAGPVARECLDGWYVQNTPAAGRWQVASEAVRPEQLALPCLCLIPSSDRIVPPASAQALARAIPGAEILVPQAGHIGMVVSAQAPARVWAPLHDWLRAQAARAG